MTDGEVRQAIRDFVTTELASPSRHHELDDHGDLIATGVVDSLGIMDLVGFIESAFAIRVADADLLPENLSSIAAIASFVRRCWSVQRTAESCVPALKP